MRHFRFTALAIVVLALQGTVSAGSTPLPTPRESVNLKRYAGDWFVHGCIPLRIPFFSDIDARNYTEHYELTGQDGIVMTSAFDSGDSDHATRRSFSFKGDIIDSALKATWKIWFLWPIGAQYSIVYLDESYNTTIVASANRRYAWIMSRKPYIDDVEYNDLLGFLQQAGFDAAKFRRVPHDRNQVAQIN